MSTTGKMEETIIKPKQPSRAEGGGKRQKRKPPTPKALSDEARQQMISEAAYFKAASRGFTGGDPEQDWLEAEAELEAALPGSSTRKS